MKNRNSFIQRNLNDLESEIHIALSRPFHSNLPHHLQLSHSIHRKFLFLRNLLSAETASNPTRHHHSPYFEIRLSELEAVFRHWEGDSEDFPVIAAEEDRVDEDRSTCSCTDSSMEGPAGWDSLVDGGFERGFVEEEEKEERLVQGQVENVALGLIEDSSGKMGCQEMIQRNRGDPPSSSKSDKLWKTIFIFGVIFVATVMYLQCYGDLDQDLQTGGDHVVEEGFIPIPIPT